MVVINSRAQLTELSSQLRQLDRKEASTVEIVRLDSTTITVRSGHRSVHIDTDGAIRVYPA